MAYEQIQQNLLREQERRRAIQRQRLNSPAYNPNQQVSGRSIPYSPIQGLTELGKAWLQKKSIDESDARTKALNEQAAQGRQDAYGQFTGQYYGQDKQPLNNAQGNEMAGPQVAKNEAYEANPVKAAMFAMQDPYLKDTGLGRAMMPAKDRGSYSRYVDYTDPKDGQTRQVVFNTRAPAGMQLTELDGTPIRTKGLSTKDAGVKAKAASAIEQAKIIGADAATARIDLPAAEVKASETLTLIDELLDHPGFKDAVGFWDNPLALGGLMPATEAAGFRSRLKQLEGRTFMEIFPTLKGGGQITEIEGEKGQLSINRMASATNEAEFIDAANDFKSEVERLRGIIRAKAGKENKKELTTSADKRQQLLDKYK